MCKSRWGCENRGKTPLCPGIKSSRRTAQDTGEDCVYFLSYLRITLEILVRQAYYIQRYTLVYYAKKGKFNLRRHSLRQEGELTPV